MLGFGDSSKPEIR
jgi:pimeloyl-ACP methyl ester carboxylesterase